MKRSWRDWFVQAAAGHRRRARQGNPPPRPEARQPRARRARDPPDPRLRPGAARGRLGLHLEADRHAGVLPARGPSRRGGLARFRRLLPRRHLLHARGGPLAVRRRRRPRGAPRARPGRSAPLRALAPRGRDRRPAPGDRAPSPGALPGRRRAPRRRCSASKRRAGGRPPERPRRAVPDDGPRTASGRIPAPRHRAKRAGRISLSQVPSEGPSSNRTFSGASTLVPSQPSTSYSRQRSGRFS